jgi:hypothetical protein
VGSGDEESRDFRWKAQFLIEFLSILSRRLSFLAGELQLSVSKGERGGGGVTMCANKKSFKT